MTNWKTTALGVLTVVGAVVKMAMALLNGQAPGLEDAGLVAAGVGLVAAADAKKRQ